jgi:radical SAM superfamily enzyme YgiQ (UPF0313 family)
MNKKCKVALVCFGNEESYGLSFVAGELLLFGQEIKFFDSEIGDDLTINNINNFNPDFVMFSPMTTFFNRALYVADHIKNDLPSVSIVFGGHHASSYPNIIKCDSIDTVVIGPVRGTIEKILNGKTGIVKSILTTPEDLPMPAREQYYRDIPRIGERYRKVMISLFGCPWDCSYCSSSSTHLKEVYGSKNHIRYFLSRRPIDHIMAEAHEILRLSETHEIEWVDDDIFSGRHYEEWLSEFIDRWSSEIKLPMYVSTTSKGILNASNDILKKLKKIVNCVGMGVQASRPDSLKLFNRSWDNESQMKAAYDRLVSFGYKVNLQAIVGLPVADPVNDAIETIKCIQRIAPCSICSIYPLMVYPGTKIDKYIKSNGKLLYEKCDGDTNSGIPNIKFNEIETKQLKNICKLATLFVKYNIDENWMKVLINIDFDENTSKELSMERYYECVVDRLGEKGKQLFNEIQKTMKLRF